MKRRGRYHCRDPPSGPSWDVLGVLFSGTTLSYVIDRWQRRRSFRHAPEKPVYMDPSYATALGHALQRAKQYQDHPAILAINPKYLEERPKGKGALYVDELIAGSFYPFPAIRPRGIDDQKAYDRIALVSSIVHRPKNDIITLVDRAIAAYERVL